MSVPGIVWQTWFAGQTPPHCGEVLCAHSATMSTQPHGPVAERGRQSWLTGQVPPHCGAWLCEQRTGSLAQRQCPVPSSLHVEPVGQTPPHCGAGLWSHGIGMSMQLHPPDAASARQI
jgi:hypothetical protein